MGKKFRETKSPNSVVPGPGQYEPVIETVTTRGPKVSITQGGRSDPVTSKFLNCGPGSYDI